MNQPSFKKISQMTRDTAEIAKQNQEIADNVLKDVLVLFLAGHQTYITATSEEH